MNIVSTRLMGGLGNYMFQIATAYAYSKKTNKNLIFNSNDIYVVHGSVDSYKDNILSNIVFESLNQNSFGKRYNEPSFNFNEIPNFDGNVYLNGYFQSEKYFKNYRNEILDLFEFDNKTKDFINKKYGDLLNNKICSIHIRRGDYLGLPDHHPTQPLEYYVNALGEFDNNTKFLVFSDDIEWCKINFSSINKDFTFIEGNTDYQDLYLMSICNDNIICNSTFSWWGAWLNKNENKQVVIPSNWFGPKLKNHNTNDLYCEGWFKI
jgi:hypothetical protein